MGRKVLISFIGTGPVDNKNNSGKRVYKTARYRFEEKEIETSFGAEIGRASCRERV